MKQGEAWEFVVGAKREKRTLRIAARRGEEMQLEKDGNSPNYAKLLLNVRQTPDGFALRSIERKSATGGMRIVFAEDFSLTAPGETAFQIDLGKQKSVAGGTISVEKQSEEVLLKWRFKSPDWAKPKNMTTLIKISAAGYTMKTY